MDQVGAHIGGRHLCQVSLEANELGKDRQVMSVIDEGIGAYSFNLLGLQEALDR